MNILELAKFNNLQLNETKDKFVVIPVGKFGYQSYPDGKMKQYDAETGQYVDVDVTGTVEITQEELIALRQHTACWEGNKLVSNELSEDVIAAKKLVDEYMTKSNALGTAKQWLISKDYIGVKIAHVALMGTQAEVDALKAEYADVIKEANEKRAVINELTAYVNENREKYHLASSIIQKEYSIQ